MTEIDALAKEFRERFTYQSVYGDLVPETTIKELKQWIFGEFAPRLLDWAMFDLVAGRPAAWETFKQKKEQLYAIVGKK